MERPVVPDSLRCLRFSLTSCIPTGIRVSRRLRMRSCAGADMDLFGRSSLAFYSGKIRHRTSGFAYLIQKLEAVLA